MLLGKLRTGVAALLVVSALAAAKSGLAFQAQGTESGTKAAGGTDSPLYARAFRPGDGTEQKPGDIHKPIAGAKDEFQQLIDKEQKIADLVSQKKKELQQLIDQQAKLRDLLSEKKDELQRLVERQAKGGQGTGDKKPDSPGLRKIADLVSQKKKELQQLIDQQAEEEQRARDKGTKSEER